MPENAISHKLLALRRSLDLTQAEFAQETGFSLRAISAWETGERIPKNRNMEEIERLVAQTLSNTTKKRTAQSSNTNTQAESEEMYRLKYEALMEEFSKEMNEKNNIIIKLQQELLSATGGESKKSLGFPKKKQA